MPADLLICATGWEPSLSFFSPREKARLGLPTRVSEEPTTGAVEWQDLCDRARRHVLQRFPGLANSPSYYRRVPTTTPYRLYRGIAPICGDRSVVFLGFIQVGNNFMAAESQALWALAYLDGRIDLPDKGQMAWEVELTNAWNQLRYLDRGWEGNFLYFDLIPYVDMLLSDIGLTSHRRLWLKTQITPFTARHLKPLCQEYCTKTQRHDIH